MHVQCMFNRVCIYMYMILKANFRCWSNENNVLNNAMNVYIHFSIVYRVLILHL